MKRTPSYRKKSVRKKSVRTSAGTRHYAVVRLNGKDKVLGNWQAIDSKPLYELLIGEWHSYGRTADSFVATPLSPQRTKRVNSCRYTHQRLGRAS